MLGLDKHPALENTINADLVAAAKAVGFPVTNAAEVRAELVKAIDSVAVPAVLAPFSAEISAYKANLETELCKELGV